MAVRQGVESWPAARTAFHSMNAGWLNFVPLFLLSLAALVTFRRALIAAPSAAMAPLASATMSAAAVASSPLPPDAKGRTFLATNVTPESLMAVCEGKTSAHMARAAEPYIGKWMRHAGTVKNVNIYGSRVQSDSMRMVW